MSDLSFLESLTENVHQTVLGTPYDREQYRTLLPGSPIETIVNSITTQFPAPFLKELAEDVFRAVYQPEAVRRTSPDPATCVSNPILSALTKHPAYPMLRQKTVNNPAASLAAAASMLPTLMSAALSIGYEKRTLLNKLSKTADPAALADQRSVVNAAAERLQQMADAVTNPAVQAKLQEAAKSAASMATNLKRQGREAEKELADTGAKLAQAMADSSGSVTECVTQALDTASATVNTVPSVNEQLEELYGLFGTGSNDGTSTAVRPQVVATLATKKSRLIKTLAQVLGRLRQIALHIKQGRMNGGVGTMHAYHESRDVGHMTGASMSLLASHTTRPIWRKQFAEGRLLTHQMRSPQSAGRGPVILVLDRSGSMTARLNCPLFADCNREEAAMALSIAVLLACHEQGRDCAVVQTASTSSCRIYPAGKVTANDLDDLILSLQDDHGGDTDFGHWIDKDVQPLLAQREFKQADVIVVSDIYHIGECMGEGTGYYEQSPEQSYMDLSVITQRNLEWKAQRERDGIRAFAVVVGKERSTRKGVTDLSAIVDQAAWLDERSEEAILNDIFERVV